MDPDLTLPYVAATLKKAIDAYNNIAGFDISQNPGITATLYNVGNPEGRARALKAENEAAHARGEAGGRACRKRITTAGWSTRSCRNCRRCSRTPAYLRHGKIARSAGSRSHRPPHMNRPR